MKSILQGIALLSAAALIAGCDSNSGGTSSVGVTPPVPQVSAAGSGTKGIIDGGVVTATDADGDQIGSTRTVAGSYTLVFDAAAVTAGITDPITVTITADAGTTAICDYRNPTTPGNDCPTGLAAPNDFAAFSESYALPVGFVLRSVVSGASAGGISHITPASEIALLKAIEKAGGPTLTAAQVTEANLAITGLLEAISGIPFDGVDFTQIQPANLAATGAVSDSDVSLILGAFASSIIAQQGTGSLADAITALAALITIDATGNVTANGNNLGAFADAFALGLANAAAARPTIGLRNAANNANANSAIFKTFGTGFVVIAPSSPTGTGTPVANTKKFVLELATAVNQATATTGSQGSGGQTTLSVTEAFAAELDAVARLSSDNATKAFNKLSAAVLADAQAIVAGTKTSPVTNAVETEGDDGLEYVLTQATGGDFSLAGVSSRWPIATPTSGTQVTVTAADGTATDAAAGSDIFALNGIEMVTTSTASEVTTTIQTFTGSLSSAAAATSTAEAPVFDYALSGSVAGNAATSTRTFAITATATADAADAGTYSVTFTFTDPVESNVAITFKGTIGAAAQSYNIVTATANISGTVTRDGATDVVTITNATGDATLTLTVTDGVVVEGTGSVIGTFTSGTDNAATATLLSNGVVSYSDGSIQLLPAILFPETTN